MSHDDAGDFPPAPAKKKSPAEEEAEKRRKKLTPGSLMKAVIRSGSGDATPAEGDQVVLHCTTRTMDGIVVNSTRREHGGKGVPLRFVLGKSKMILGFAEGFPTVLKGEIAMFKMKPQIHYAEDDCPVTAPDGFPKDDELQFEIEMLDFFKAKVVAEDLGVVKKGDGCYMGEEQLERGDGYYMSSRIGNNKVVCKVSMDSLHLVHVKLLAADLLSLTARHTSPPSFVRCGRTVARAELVGVVVSRDRREKFLRFLVDDGTGSVPCVLWLNHQYMNANSSSGTLDSDPTAEMALKMSEVVRLGTLLRVRGRIVMYRGAIQIAVRDVVLEKDPNVEVLHWLQCVRMAKECYDLPPPSA